MKYLKTTQRRYQPLLKTNCLILAFYYFAFEVTGIHHLQIFQLSRHHGSRDIAYRQTDRETSPRNSPCPKTLKISVSHT